MIRTLKALSALLTHPTADLKVAAPEIGPALAAEGVLPPDRLAALEPLLVELATRDLMDLQERFVLLFDRSRTLSLNLFEHIHGESRERGQAVVDLLDPIAPAAGNRSGLSCPIICRSCPSSSACVRWPRHGRRWPTPATSSPFAATGWSGAAVPKRQ